MPALNELENGYAAFVARQRELDEKIEDLKREEQYVRFLEKNGWPLFLYNQNLPLRHQLLEATNNTEQFTKIVASFFDSKFWAKAATIWMNSEAIKADRKPILLEGVRLHLEERYYASVSLLMCQVYGIASDISDILKEVGLETDDDMKDKIARFYNILPDKIDLEKGKLLQAISHTQSGAFLWIAAGTYLKENILASSDSKSRQLHQPLRNKICHGDQLNFGTQEHSLKALLTVDMLVQMADEIQSYANMVVNPKQPQENIL